MAGYDGSLDVTGWACSEEGEVKGGLPQWVSGSGSEAFFKHSQPVHAEDVVRMKVEEGKNMCAGFSGQDYDPKQHWETGKSSAFVILGNGGGTTEINRNISQDGGKHRHPYRLQDHVPETKPYDVALRCDKDGNVPQMQFNDDGVWHDFAPEGGTGLVAGPWFLYLRLLSGDCVSDLRVDRPKPTKSAGKTKTAADGAGAVAVVTATIAQQDDGPGAGIDTAARPAAGALAVDAFAATRLDHEGWYHNEEGEVVGGVPQWSEGGQDYAHFKHSQPVRAEDVVRMKVEEGKYAVVGFAGQQYDPKKHGAMINSTAFVFLKGGTTVIYCDISQDGEAHRHPGYLKGHIPETKPFDVALRCDKDGNVPQIQFNDDGVWHDFAPGGRTGLVAGPWFPFLQLLDGDRVSDLRVTVSTS